MRGSLWPREHGATAELAFPLLTGLGLGGLSPGGLALALSAVAFYLSHEPVAVLLGRRGVRVREQLASRARVRGGALLGMGLVLATGSIAVAGGSLWPWILFPASAAVLLLPLVLARKEKTLVGEFLVILAFAGLVLPLASTGDTDPSRAFAAALVWIVSFGLGTFEVHAIKARAKRRGGRQQRRPGRSWTSWASPLLAGVVVLGAATGLLLRIWPDPSPLLAVLPPAAAVLSIGLMKVPARNLKRVGWSMVGANAVALGLLLLGGLS